MDGFGTYHFADGGTCEGLVRKNWPEGEGTARYANGGVYVGRWKDGKYEVIYPVAADVGDKPVVAFDAPSVETRCSKSLSKWQGKYCAIFLSFFFAFLRVVFKKSCVQALPPNQKARF